MPVLVLCSGVISAFAGVRLVWSLAVDWGDSWPRPRAGY